MTVAKPSSREYLSIADAASVSARRAAVTLLHRSPAPIRRQGRRLPNQDGNERIEPEAFASGFLLLDRK